MNYVISNKVFAELNQSSKGSREAYIRVIHSRAVFQLSVFETRCSRMRCEIHGTAVHGILCVSVLKTPAVSFAIQCKFIRYKKRFEVELLAFSHLQDIIPELLCNFARLTPCLCNLEVACISF